MTPGANSQTWVTQTSQSGYAGESYLRALPDIGQLYEIDELDDSPQLTYPIYAPESAGYTVWVRAMAAGAAGDSLHLGLNGQAVADTTRLTGFDNQSWQWQSVTMSNTQPVLSLEAGADSLNLWMREDGLRLDRLLLVTDTNYIPTGSGPSASSLQLITHSVPAQQNSHIIHYTYDDLYRLTEATYSGDINSEYNYAYDPVGNMTAYTETVGAETSRVTRTFDDANRLQTSFDLEIGTTNYLYDNNGNLSLVIPPGGESWLHYEYDQRNLMISHTISISGTSPQLQATYSYDGSSNRVQQVDDTGTTPITTTYTNDIMGLSQVLVADDGSSQTHMLYGLDLISQDDSNATRYLLADGLGSVRVELVDDTIETTTTYAPFGSLLQQTGSSGTVYGFTGEQYDTSTEQLYLRARYYNPALHTFTSKDPWNGNPASPQSMNGWSYVENNPLNFTDPTGMFPEHCRSASSFRLYGYCVRDHYKVSQLWDDYEHFVADILEFKVPEPGCYEGPVPYRGKGYTEGVSSQVTIVGGGYEMVYDFASMEKQNFYYWNVVPSTTASGLVGTFTGGKNVFFDWFNLSISASAGYLRGFRSWQGPDIGGITNDYSGYFAVYSAQAPKIPGIPFSVSGSYFHGSPDTTITGHSFSFGLSANVWDILGVSTASSMLDNFSGNLAYYYPAGPVSTYYNADTSNPNKRSVMPSHVVGDVLLGAKSPLTYAMLAAGGLALTGVGTAPSLLFIAAGTAARAYGAVQANHWADIYNGINYDSWR